MIERFILLHIKHYNVINYDAIIICLRTEKSIFINECILITYTEYKDRYHFSLLLYDRKQDKNMLKSLRTFKKFMRTLNKPVYINNVLPEFRRMFTHVKLKTYKWKV